MANSRGAPPLLRLRLRRLLRSPISRCACLLLAFAGILLIASLRQVARVDLPRPDPPRQARFVIPLLSTSVTAATVSSLKFARDVSSEKLWASNGYGYHACVKPTSRYKVPTESDRYMTVRIMEGSIKCALDLLAQICDMVAVARLVNVTLVIPQLDKRSFWQDTRDGTKHWKLKDINSTQQRSEGNCPLTPNEVGSFLHAMGYPESTWIYLAAGEIYGGDKYLSKLRLYFPNLVTKEVLATKDELEMFNNHASQVAALDYIISVESDVFVPSHSGNMAKAVEGHRRFLGHRRTITPDRRGLVKLFDLLEKGELIGGPKLSSLVTEMHKYRQGTPRERYSSLPGSKGRARLRTEESFYENPLPECICLIGKH
ncbi:hypothetical protein PR202_gb00329 [Eleusine coracana subsp. coracana]|uniref:O-fucosyltransferase family protein n=1 Tax=Eleusine coracana subsp. coracana TaxID=191504 RepID=A0AAV5DT14_ELECO|nr:hypothetical protein PR202_gb00329 [Eleusine coracana subsp. coracana]